VAEAVDLEAPITAVTVFRDGARVVRTGTLTLDPGMRQVTIAGLPAAADPASVRVAVRGHHLALLDVEVHKRFAADPRRRDLVQLRTEAEERRDEVQALDDADAAEQASLAFAGHLSEAAATALARAVSFGRISHDELDQMSAHLAAATSSALGRRREIAARRRAAHRELQAAEQRLADSEKRPRPAQYTDVSATLEVTAGTEAEIELSYHVSGVSWRPLYDLGLAGDQLTVSYLAEITQRTGEDWPAVPLVASTTRQGEHQTLPELRPWYVGRQRVTPYPPMAAGFGAQTLSAYEGAATQPGGPVPPPAQAVARASAAPMAEPIVAEVSEAGAALAYEVQRPLVIPSDGSPHKTTIARFELDAVLDHLAVPVQALEAYLRATVTNDSKLLLLPGPARVFHDGQFVGETTLETVAAGEEFELQLGVDDQIRVERELRRRSTSKAVIGGSRTVDIAYEITIQNHRSAKARINVHDHIPLSSDGEVKVRLRETTPNPAEHTDLGELIWKFELDPGRSATITHRFTVDHPASVTLAGL
jgi:uncharacterized protein (TIGR02231 family)